MGLDPRLGNQNWELPPLPGGGGTGTAPGTGTGTAPNQGQQAPLNTDPFNLPQFGGPYVAPLTSGQTDALQGFNRLFNGNPLLQTQDLQKAIEFGVSGGPVYHPNMGKTLQEQTEPFRLPSGALNMATGMAQDGMRSPTPNLTNTDPARSMAQTFATGGGMPGGPDLGGAKNVFSTTAGNTLNAQNNPQRFNNTEMFRLGESVFNSDLDQHMARMREEFSGLGLGPGASDRSEGLFREAANQQNKFRLGQQQIAQQDFENAEQRRLGAMGLGNQLAQTGTSMGATEYGQQLQNRGQQMQGLEQLFNIQQLPFNQQMQVNRDINEPAANRMQNLIPMLAGLEELPFQRMMALGEPAANRAMQALPAIFELEQRPFDRFQQQFQLNEQARGVADQESLRRMAENARTQGGGLQQLMSIMSGVPLNNTGIGPSQFSQWASLFGNLFNAGASAYGAGGG